MTRSQWRTAGFGAVLMLLVVALPASAKSPRPVARPPVLGHAGAWYSGTGFGQVRPRHVDLGGDPTGDLHGIRWSSWDGLVARGAGTGFYVGPSQFVYQGHEEPADVVAFQLGRCHGRRAYRAIEWWFPRHHEHFDPRQSIGACDGDKGR